VGLRIISVLLAIGLWLFVNAGQHGSVESYNVAVTYRNLPPHMIITNFRQQNIKISVSGPRTLLSLIDPSRLTLRLDLTGVGIGEASFKISPESFNVPRQTNVISIEPSQIALDVDEIINRELPVHLTLAGVPPMGYRISSTQVNPRTVTVRGPSKALARTDDVDTDPIDMSDSTTNLARMVDLVAPFDGARVQPTEVAANVMVGEVVVEKEFRAMPIHVSGNGYVFRIDPGHVNLTVRGPQLAIAKLNLDQAVSIDADDLAPGLYDAAIQVNLPDGVELVHQSAVKVRLRLYHERIAAP
jgi:YbbR domain-containing protein